MWEKASAAKSPPPRCCCCRRPRRGGGGGESSPARCTRRISLTPWWIFLLIGVVFLVVRTSGYFFMVLQYIIVLFCVFGEEWPNGRPEVEPNFPPQRFPTELDLTAWKFRQKGREWWATLKIHLEQKWTGFSSTKRSRQNTKCLVLDLPVLYCMWSDNKKIIWILCLH